MVRTNWLGWVPIGLGKATADVLGLACHSVDLLHLTLACDGVAASSGSVTTSTVLLLDHDRRAEESQVLISLALSALLLPAALLSDSRGEVGNYAGYVGCLWSRERCASGIGVFVLALKFATSALLVESLLESVHSDDLVSIVHCESVQAELQRAVVQERLRVDSSDGDLSGCLRELFVSGGVV